MIELTKLNGSTLVVNSDLIKYAEASPDTTLTLVNGEKLVVLEPLAELIARVAQHRTRLLVEAARLFPAGTPSAMAFSAALRALDAEQSQHTPSDPGIAEAAQQRRRKPGY